MVFDTLDERRQGEDRDHTISRTWAWSWYFDIRHHQGRSCFLETLVRADCLAGVQFHSLHI